MHPGAMLFKCLQPCLCKRVSVPSCLPLSLIGLSLVGL